MISNRLSILRRHLQMARNPVQASDIQKTADDKRFQAAQAALFSSFYYQTVLFDSAGVNVAPNQSLSRTFDRENFPVEVIGIVSNMPAGYTMQIDVQGRRPWGKSMWPAFCVRHRDPTTAGIFDPQWLSNPFTVQQGEQYVITVTNTGVAAPFNFFVAFICEQVLQELPTNLRRGNLPTDDDIKAVIANSAQQRTVFLHMDIDYTAARQNDAVVSETFTEPLICLGASTTALYSTLEVTDPRGHSWSLGVFPIFAFAGNHNSQRSQWIYQPEGFFINKNTSLRAKARTGASANGFGGGDDGANLIPVILECVTL